MTHDPDTAIDYLSIPEAARHSLISESGLRACVRNGILPSKRVGPYRSIVVSR